MLASTTARKRISLWSKFFQDELNEGRAHNCTLLKTFLIKNCGDIFIHISSWKLLGKMLLKSHHLQACNYQILEQKHTVKGKKKNSIEIKKSGMAIVGNGRREILHPVWFRTSLKLPDWFVNPQINKFGSWEHQAWLVFFLMNGILIIIIFFKNQKQTGSQIVTEPELLNSHLSTLVMKQHSATLNRQPYNDLGVLSSQDLRPCIPWWDYSHAKNYAVAELTAEKSLKCSYAW